MRPTEPRPTPSRGPLRVLVSTLGLALAGALSVSAQETEPEAPESSTLKPTVVVATKTAKDSETLPPSISTLGGGEIQARQYYQVDRALSTLPGVTVVQTGQAGGQASLFIRGMESNHTVVLLNGRRLPPGLAGLYNLELLDTTFLDSLQLARGPVSSLYGSDAIAGALDLRMVEASQVEEGFHATLFGEGGSFSSGRAGTQLTYGQGPVGAVFDVSFFDTENDRPNSDFRNLNLRGQFDIEIADGIHFDLLGFFQDSELGAPGSSLSPTFPEAQRNDNQSWLVSPRLTIERDDWTLTSFYSYGETELTAVDAPFFSDNRLNQDSHEFEVQLDYHPTEDATYTIGAGYYENAFERRPLVPGAASAPASKRYGYGSVFGQADIQLPANFSVVASARWDEHDSFESKGTWSVLLGYHLEATDTRFFAKAATGYKAPSGQDFVFLDHSVDPDTILPEESLSWEIGVRQALPNGLGSVSATYFHNDLENLVDSLGFPAFPAQVDTRTQGVELGAELTPVEGLRLYVYYTYLDAKVTEGQYFGGFAGSPGDRLIRRPRHTLSAGVSYAHGQDWLLGLEVQGAYDRLDNLGTFLSDYTLVRLYGECRLHENVQLFARVENLFDESYETTAGYEGLGLGAYGGLRITF